MGPSGQTSEISANDARIRMDTRYFCHYEQPLGTVLSTTLGWSFVRPIGSGFGPELGYADMTPACAIVKVAVSGTALATQWLPGSSPDDLYALAKSKLDVALADLPVANLAGFYWCQGEADANTQQSADAYAANLATLVARLRSDYSAPSLPVVLNQLHVSSSEAFTANVRAQQNLFVANDAHAAIFSVDDLALKVDSVHLTSAAQLTAGQRAAAAMQGLL